MLDNLNQILIEMLRILFIYGLPTIIFLAFVGTISSTIQAATLINEQAIGYVVRLLAFVLVCYLFGARFISDIINLAEMAFK